MVTQTYKDVPNDKVNQNKLPSSYGEKLGRVQGRTLEISGSM